MAELKLLDPNRKAILALPHGAFKVWMGFYMCEGDDQEFYVSLEKLEEIIDMDRKTLLKWRDYLLETGWLLKLSGYAASRYAKPTRGAHTVAIYRVDDPSKNKGGNIPPFQENSDVTESTSSPAKGGNIPPIQGCQEKEWNFSTPQKTHTSFVSVSSSLPEALAGSVPTTTTPSADADTSRLQSLRSLTTQDLRPKQTKTKTSASPVKVKVKHNPKYDQPFPYDFSTWTQVDRTRWSIEHLVPVQGEKNSVPVRDQKDSAPIEKQTTTNPVRPPNTPPPPTGQGGVAGTAKAMLQCPACEYISKFGYNVAEHIEKEHPEFGKQSFTVPCPVDGCNWRTWWNKVENNQAKKEEERVRHYEVQHNPESPDYDPWDDCPTCHIPCKVSAMGSHKCKGNP